MSTNQQAERITIRLPKERLRQLQLIAAKAGGQSVSDIVRRALDEFLNSSRDSGSDQFSGVFVEMEKMQLQISEMKNSKNDSRIAEALIGLIEHVYLPMSPLDRKQPIFSILRMLKGE